MGNKTVEIAILCGGSGGRMGKLAFDKQKCMLSVDGRPILEHLFEQIIKAFDTAKIILLVGHRSNDIYDYFGEHYKGLQLNYAPETTVGTRAALLCAKEFIEGDNFICMDGDEIVNGMELTRLVDLDYTDSLGALLVSSRLETAPTHGLVIMKGRRITKIDYPPTNVISKNRPLRLMDIGFYSKKMFDYLKATDASMISEVLDDLIGGGKIIEGKIYRGDWFHFVEPKDLLAHIQF